MGVDERSRYFTLPFRNFAGNMAPSKLYDFDPIEADDELELVNKKVVF